METAQARSVYLPRLGGTLRFGTIAHPINISEEKPTTEQEKSLAQAVQFIMAFPAGHAMTYTRWQEISGVVEKSISQAAFVDDLRTSIAGDDKDKREKFDNTLSEIKLLLRNNIERVPDVATYATIVLRNVVLSNGLNRDTRLNTLLGLSGYDDASIVRSLHHDLSRWDEPTLALWSAVTSATLNERILPSIKSGFDELLVLEIPFSGSPKIISMTLAEAMKRARGCALAVAGSAAIGAGGALAVSGSPLIALSITVTGLACAILFVGFGAALPKLEEAIERGVGRIFNERS